MIFLSWILRDFSRTWGKVFEVGGQVVEAAWVTERKGTGLLGGGVSVGRGKEWGGTGEDGGAQQGQEWGGGSQRQAILEGLRRGQGDLPSR